jgi:hypothetical protein
VLLLIGIGVALGVAFSGPELEVVDPTVPASGSSGSATGTATPPSGSATGAGAPRQPQAPSELPGPPPATSGTP